MKEQYMKEQYMKEQQDERMIDMLNGPLSGKIIRFALPLAGSSMLQQLFNAADTAIVGKFDGSKALAAVGSNSMVISLFLNMFIGLSIGANVVVAKYVGSNREDWIKKSVHTVVMLSVLSGFLLLIFGQIVAQKVLILMQTPEDVIYQAALYLRIYCLGMPFILIYNFGSAILRCKGDTKRPLYALILSGLINVGLNLLFVIKWKWGVVGVGIATVIANIVSGSMVLSFLMHEKGAIKLHLHELGLNPKCLIEVLKVGIPAGVQGMCFSIANVCIQLAVNGFGSSGIAGFSIAVTFETMTYYISNAFGQTAVTFISQNYSVGNRKRCRLIFALCLVYGSLLCEGASLLLVVGQHFFISLFTIDRCTAAYAAIRMYRVVAFNGLTSGYEVGSGMLRAFGHSVSSALIVVAGCCCFRILWIFFVFRQVRSFEILMSAYPISWVITDMLMLGACYYYSVISTHQK